MSREFEFDFEDNYEHGYDEVNADEKTQEIPVECEVYEREPEEEEIPFIPDQSREGAITAAEHFSTDAPSAQKIEQETFSEENIPARDGSFENEFRAESESFSDKRLDGEDEHFSSSFRAEQNAFSEHGFTAEQVQRPIRRKKGGALKRAVALAAGAAVFGIIAGGTMVGINRLAYDRGILPRQETAQETQAKLKEVTLQTAGVTNAANSAQSEATASSEIVVNIAEKAMSSVVAINAETKISRESWFGESRTYTIPTSGSGIIIGENDEELLIVTNNHVVEDSKNLKVVFIDESEIKATVKGGDADNDLAVIAVKLSDLSQETLDKISLATVGSSDDLKVGQGVVAIGNALGYGQSVTVGYVSALNRTVETERGEENKFIQTDAAINPGNSGGALLNMRGEVIGINSAKYSDTKVEGMGYAIPITAVQDIITELSNKPTRTVVAADEQGTLGIRAQNIDDEVSEAYDIPKGVYIYSILEGGAAEKSDLQEKDIIIKINEDKISDYEQLKEVLSYYKAGDTVMVTIQRLEGSEYVEEQAEVTLGSKKEINSKN